MTQTIPGPPPGAGVVLATASDFAVAAAGLGEAFDLNISASVFFGDPAGLATGEAAVAGVVMAVFFRAPFEAGSVTAWVVAAGDAVAAAFLRDFLAGDADASAAGDSPAPGDASLAAFLRDFLAGEADASGEAPAEALAAGVGD